MSSTNTIDSSSFLNNLTIENKNTSAKEAETNDKDMFMRLMLAQLENQNPLQPQDGTQFLAQLAQFSSLEGISKLNTSVQDIASLYRSTQALQATALVGRSVQVDGSKGYFDGSNDMSGVIKSGQAATDATMTVKDSKGSVVATYEIGNVSSEETDFTWSGTDANGDAVAAGTYSVAIEGLVDGERTALTTGMNIRVNSVSITDNQGGMKLNLADGSSVNSDSINQIL